MRKYAYEKRKRPRSRIGARPSLDLAGRCDHEPFQAQIGERTARLLAVRLRQPKGAHVVAPPMGESRLNGNHRWRHLAQGAPLSAFAMIYNQVLSFAVGILVARVIGASQYGVFSVARSILEILGIVSPLGLDLAMQRHLGSGLHSTRLRQLGFFRLTAFVLGIAPAALATLGLGNYIEQALYPYPDFANILLGTLIALPFVTDLAVLGGAYRGVLKPGPSILTSYVLQPTVRAIVMIALFAFGLRLWAVVVGTSVSFVISWAVLAFRARTDLAPRGAIARFDWADTRSVFLYAPSLAASLIFVTCMRSVDSLFLGHFGTAKDVGQYGAILMITQLIGLLGFALGQTLGPRIAQCHQNNDIAGMETLLAENIRWTSLVSAPVFAGIVFWGDRIDLVLGPTFAVDRWVVSIVAARMLLHTILANSGFALSMTGWHLRETGIVAIGLLASVIMCFVLIPSYGQLGAALASFIAFSGTNLIRYVAVRSVFDIRPIKLAAARPVVLSLMTAGLTYLLFQPIDHRTLSFTLLEVAVFSVLFVGSAWFVLTTDHDREIISSVLAPTPRIEGVGG
jgi:O-antigen/teichoic acid export membrane protein